MPKKQIDVKAITSGLKTKSAGNMGLTGYDFVRYGKDDKYPTETFEAIRLSPTAKGCVDRKTQFVFGLGVDDTGIIVNRHGDTLNQVLRKAINTYSWLNSYVFHFNYNLLGEIIEIQNVDIRYCRKKTGLKKGMIDQFSNGRSTFLSQRAEIFLYDYENLAQQIEDDEGFDNFNGNLFYWTVDGTIYTLSSADASLNSAQFESSVQVYNYATIENGFSASGVIKLPSLQNGDDKEAFDKEIAALKGAANAGGLVSVELPQNIEGKNENVNMFEPFTIQNIDKMFVNQTKDSKEHILREFRIPEILLGTSPDGMFNQESFADAAIYYNNETEGDRLMLQESFNKFWENTVFKSQLNTIEIQPLDMSKFKKEEPNGSRPTTDNDQ